MFKLLLILVCFVVLAIDVQAQSSSELQSAGLVGKSQFDLTGLYTRSNNEIGPASFSQNHFGLRLGYGLMDNINLRIGYERVSNDFEDLNLIGFGPKFPIVNGRFSFYLPLLISFGDPQFSGDDWQLHPTVLFTLPVNQNIEINPSAKWLMPLGEDGEHLMALNLGAALSSDLNIWAVRPEVGLLYDPGTSGRYIHFSIGLSFNPLYEDECCPQKLRRNR